MRVVPYARVSSDAQDVDLSISTQLKALRDYAKKYEHEIVIEFVDEAESGRTSARPAFKSMLAFCRRSENNVDAVLVWKYSRFARNREDSIVSKAILKKAGVQVISINEPFEDSPTGRLMEAIIESLDEFYSNNLGEEVTRGMRESASRGFYLSSKPPYGYNKIKVKDSTKERTKLELNQPQAGIVKEIFEGVLSGQSLLDITRIYNSKGIPSPRGKKWGKTAVYTILTNEIYTGTFVWGKNSKRGYPPVRTENAFPVVIDKDVFDRVRILMKERMPKKVHPRRTSSPFLLSGLANCGYCNKALIGRYAKSGNFAYYVCGTLDKTGAGSCKAKYLNVDKFESAVIEQLTAHILTPENLSELIRLANAELESTSLSKKAELENICLLIDDVSRRLDRLYDAIETGHLDLADLALRIKELRLKHEQLYAQKVMVENELSEKKVELIDMKTMTKYALEMQQIIREGTLVHKRTFIKGFIKEITVTGKKAVMKYSLPDLPESVELDLEGVPRTVQYGGR